MPLCMCKFCPTTPQPPATLQGLPKADAQRQAGELLEKVKLLAAARQRTAAYSGGMRRRLRCGRVRAGTC